MASLDRSTGMLIARPDAVYGQGTEAWLPLDGRANAWRRLQDSGARLIDFREGVWCGTSLVWLLRVGRRCGHPARRSQARGAPQPRRLPRSTAREASASRGAELGVIFFGTLWRHCQFAQ